MSMLSQPKPTPFCAPSGPVGGALELPMAGLSAYQIRWYSPVKVNCGAREGV